MKKTTKTYADAGVDIVAGDVASSIFFEASKKTWPNRTDLPGEICLAHDLFSAHRYVEAAKFPDAILGMNFDGVGTKIEVAERVGEHSTVAFDLFAMLCDDAARTGGEPLIIGSILDCNKIEISVVEQLASGMVSAAKEARVAVINGEIAELGGRVCGYGLSSYNWGGAVVWLGRRERLLSGANIGFGDKVVAVREKGFRSNGISLARKVFSEAYGVNWHTHALGNSTIGRAILEPSCIYTRLMVQLSGGYAEEPLAPIHGLVHITGGGVPGKLGRILKPVKLGAQLDDLFVPCEAMLLCQSLAKVEDAEAYRTWNMGNGLLIITPEPDRVIAVAVHQGFEARVAGAIEKSPRINIRNKAFSASKREWLSFDI